MIRRASHGGSWYSSSSIWLENAQSFKNAKAIISPHAGYSYSGSTAAYGFKNLDSSKIKKIFILGPSHHVYLNTCALSPASEYETPLYNLKIDQGALKKFKMFTIEQDEAEHSLEMQLPFIAKIMESYKQQFTIVPIIVGSINYETEREFGMLLSNYFIEEGTVFVISSDFCHWGKRFQYTFFDPNDEIIYKSIEKLDKKGMDIIEAQDPLEFFNYLKKYSNTICGRHPIAILLQIVNYVKKQGINYEINFIKYKQSNHVENFNDSSVSYATALATSI